jgi:hypothetical protein
MTFEIFLCLDVEAALDAKAGSRDIHMEYWYDMTDSCHLAECNEVARFMSVRIPRVLNKTESQ